MKAYRAHPSAVEAFMHRRRCILLLTMPIIMPMMAVLAVPSYGIPRILRGESIVHVALSIPPFLLITLAVLIPLTVFIIMLLFRRWHAEAASYLLEMTENELRRYRDGLVPCTVHRSDVVRISESSSGIVVYTRSRGWLNIPCYLEGYDEVRDQLLAWCDFERIPIAQATVTAALIMYTAVGGWAMAQYAPTLGWRIVGDVVFLPAMLLWICIMLRQRRELDVPELHKGALAFGIIGYALLSISGLFGLLHDIELYRAGSNY
jgi:hypothetical protein